MTSMSTAILTTVILAISVIALGSSCSNTITNPNDVTFPDSAVSFTRHVLPFVRLSCGVAGCHGDVDPAGGVRLTSYTTIMFDRANLIVPGKPDESLIIQSLEQRIPHPLDIMSRVNDNQRRGMRTWIAEGALNN